MKTKQSRMFIKEGNESTDKNMQNKIYPWIKADQYYLRPEDRNNKSFHREMNQ